MLYESRGIDIAIDVFSTMGAVLWSIQLLPQIYLNWRRKSGAGLQPSMMLAWALAGLPLGIHNILGRQPIALQVQAEVLTALSLLTWAQVMYYDRSWSLLRCCCILALLCLVFSSVQAAFVLGLRHTGVKQRVREECILSMAVLAGVGLCLGVLRQHFDVYRHRTVRGIAWGFVLLDAAGDLTSLLSVVIKSPADRVAAAIYASELALWILMIAAGIVLNVYHRADSLGQRNSDMISGERQASGDLDRQASRQSASSAFGQVTPRIDVLSTASTLLRRVNVRTS